ncbi:DUF3613 domain-containing protein [Paraburkholderia sp. Ac-20342]|uniref:DUF3613 domain-containing protein n=1 Tax=Paraburkholderia sp. Ac-20342 TaxID=2703889 RepID=UPI00197CDD2B|nr:DUF3613 domain-containing protein [Paraburkholderia sp. Ac-20342]MBN3851517.1 DUF3613 domain-containing protein [Paraburkholderia sp. Ac-20342]
MTNRTETRGWRASVRCVGAIAGVFAMTVFGAASAAAQTNEPASAQTDSPTAGTTPAVQAAQPKVRASEVGHSTLAWVDMQRSNEQAAPALPMLGAEAGLAYKRYLNSFNNKIPEWYGSTLGSSSGSGGSGGGSNGGSGSGSGGWN